MPEQTRRLREPLAASVTSMLPARRTLALLSVGLVLGMAPALARAAVSLQPSSTVAGQWSVLPAGTAHWQALRDDVQSPGVPPTGDLIYSSSRNRVDRVALDNYSPGAGETVGGVEVYYYGLSTATTGGTKAEVALVEAGSQTAIASQSFGTGSGDASAGWHHFAWTGSLFPSEVNDLELRFKITAGGRSTIRVRAAYALLDTVQSAPGADDGKARIVYDVNSDQNGELVAAASDPARQAFWQGHYAENRGYPDFYSWHTFDVPWAPPPTVFYKDAYAIYRDYSGAVPDQQDQRLICAHPDWVLWDSANHPAPSDCGSGKVQADALYIDYGCSGGSCPQYAADVGNPGWRSYWIDGLGALFAEGYVGVYLDDVKLEMDASDGNGNPVTPYDPRTGQPMTQADWERYMAEFMAEIRSAYPGVRIEHNQSQWWFSEGDPSYRAETQAADAVELERGFHDPGIVPGTGTFGYDTLLAHVDWLHSLGDSVIYQPKDSPGNPFDLAAAEYELASYDLVAAVGDAIAPPKYVTMGDWWNGWDAALGAPRGPRYRWNGLWRRDFAAGLVLANPPQSTTRKVSLPVTMRTLAGAQVTSVTLAAKRGAVLRGSF